MTALNCHQNESASTNCIVNDTPITRHDSTISANLPITINSSHSESPMKSSSSSTNIKKKSSSFLHRDYNRKPILARSQVSSLATELLYTQESMLFAYVAWFMNEKMRNGSFLDCYNPLEFKGKEGKLLYTDYHLYFFFSAVLNSLLELFFLSPSFMLWF